MNQNPEQKARDQIDAALIRAGWLIQDKSRVNLSAGPGIAVRVYQTDICSGITAFDPQSTMQIFNLNNTKAFILRNK